MVTEGCGGDVRARRTLPPACKNNSGRRKARRSLRELVTLWVFILFVGAFSLLRAQVTSGIQGRVTDQQGLPFVGAEVLVRADAIGAETKESRIQTGTLKS